MDSLFGNGSPLALVGQFLWLIQLVLIVHVLRTGRPYWWILLLLFAPAIGGLAYLFIEVLPNVNTPSQGGRGYFSGLKPRAWRTRELRNALEESDTVKTRLALADELLAAGQSHEAQAVAAEALQGVFKNDPHTLAAVARFEIEVQHWPEALDLLARVDVTADHILDQQVTLLRGRARLGAGDFTEAADDFRALDGHFVGEEARYYLACALAANGQQDDAVAIWRDITRRFRRTTPAWRRSEKEWFQRAKAKLKEAAG
jgi:hypothetical protein